jgi:PIN domain nuclease of toxin-antitoxin system
MQVVDVTSEIWLLAADLNWTHREPPNRLITATVLLEEEPVLTKDRVFLAEELPVKAVW